MDAGMTSKPTTPRPQHLAARLGRKAMAAAMALAALAAASCARMGQPDGGWYDDPPPAITLPTPRDKATGVTARKIRICRPRR